MITWWMKLEGDLPSGHDALLFSISGTEYVMPSYIFYMASDYSVMDHWWGGTQCSGTRHTRTADLSVHSQTRQPPDHDDRAEKLICPA